MDEGVNDGTQLQQATGRCRWCDSEEPADHAFCSNCGELLTGEMKQTETLKSGNRVDGMGDNRIRIHIKRASISIIAASVIMFLESFYLWQKMVERVQDAKRMSEFILGMSKEAAAEVLITEKMAVEKIMAENRPLVAAAFIIGVVFLILYFRAKSNPFGAILTVSVLYVANILHCIAVIPEVMCSGLMLHVGIFVLLLNGVKAGLAYKYKKEIGPNTLEAEV